LRQRLARGLVARGILSEEHSKTLGILPTTRFPTSDPAPERELCGRLQDVLVAGREPTEEEALLIGLLEPLELIASIVPKDQRRAARKRAKTVAEQGLAGTAVRDAVRAVQAALAVTLSASSSPN
jgi:Golgi phosphoprotein 3 (GPP34)